MTKLYDSQTKTDRQTERQTDRQKTNRQTERQTDRQADRRMVVFEHFGQWGEEASTFLDKISKLYRDEEVRNNPSDLRHIGEDVCQYNFSFAMPRC